MQDKKSSHFFYTTLGTLINKPLSLDGRGKGEGERNPLSKLSPSPNRIIF